MTISFNLVPSNVRTPGVYAEIDNSRALRGLPQFLTRILVIGQRLSAGTVSEGALVQVNSVEQAKAYFGRGSQLANMFEVLKANNKYIETWAIPLNDHGSGVAATGSIVFTGSIPTENGTLSLYVAGRLLQVPILTTHTAANIATNVAAAINSNGDLPVTALASTATVNITARNKGEPGNDIDLRVNYQGTAGGEKTPTGVSVVITAMASGATNPAVSTAITALPDEIYDYFCCPYTDATNLTALETELNSRWGPMRMLEGHLFIASKGSQATLSTFGNGRNNQHVTCIGYNDSPTPSYEWAAALVAQVGYAATVDPARPFGTLKLVNILPPPETSRFDQSERNTLLYDGISTYTVTRANESLLDRVITMYQTNGVGSPDPSYLDYNSLATLAYLRQSLRTRLATKFSRFKIADNGTRFAPGQAITTPNGIKAEIVSLFTEWEASGLVEDIQQFKDEIIVERNVSDPNRVDVQLPPNLVNQLQVIAAQIQFLL